MGGRAPAAAAAVQEVTKPVSGIRSRSLDDLSLQFAIWARTSQQECLDVGCRDGMAAEAALERGGHVLAIDSDATRLERLRTRVPAQRWPRLRTWVGALPDLDFNVSSFHAIHAARTLHELRPEELRRCIGKFFQWLYPNGKLFIGALTPAGEYWRPCALEFTRRTYLGAQWPGYFEDADRFPTLDSSTGFIHLLDERVLRRELESVGFIIEKAYCCALPWDDAQISCSMVARCQ